MKKTGFFLVFFILFFGVFAAVPAVSEESDLYYVNAQILKIFPHRLGYYIIYRRAGLKTGEYFVPHTWFDRRDQRGVLNLVDTRIAPYISVLMKDGEFEQIRVYAPRDLNNQAWGVLMGDGTQYDDNFNIEKLDLKF